MTIIVSVFDYLASLVTDDDWNSWALKENQMWSWFFDKDRFDEMCPQFVSQMWDKCNTKILWCLSHRAFQKFNHGLKAENEKFSCVLAKMIKIQQMYSKSQDLALEGAENWFKGILIVSNFPCFFT